MSFTTSSSSPPEEQHTSNKHLTPQTKEHERGTPLFAASHPYCILFSLWLSCTLVSACLFSDNTWDILSVIYSGLGVASTILGIYFVNCKVHVASLAGAMTLSHFLPSSSSPASFLLFTTLFLLHLLCRHRFHRNDYLSSPPPTKFLPYTLLPILFSHITSPTLLNGANLFLVLSISFALTNESCYTVGSGQFRMVCLDTLGGYIFFVAPLYVLYHRFLALYGTYFTIPSEFVVVVQTSDVFGTLISIFVNLYGVTLLHSLSPLSSHLLGRVYTRGQPNSKRVALTVHFSHLIRQPVVLVGDLDFDAEESRQEYNLLLSDLKQLKFVMNVFVTLEECEMFQDDVLKLKKDGHTVGLLLEKKKSAELLRKEEGWCWFRCLDRNPFVVRWGCFELGMKMILWSNYVLGERLEEESVMDEFLMDVEEKNGGSVIFVDGGRNGELVTGVVRRLVKKIEQMKGNIVLDGLDGVCKEDVRMKLD